MPTAYTAAKGEGKESRRGMAGYASAIRFKADRKSRIGALNNKEPRNG